MTFLFKAIRLALATTLLMSILSCSASGKGSDTSDLDWLLENTRVSIRLYGIMEFETYGIKFRHPTTLEALTVPTGWMNLSFRGFDQRVENTQMITDQVHGTISDDGRWITSLVFTRQVTRTTSSDGVFYQVGINNLPIDIDDNGSPRIYQEGSDIRKYVESVEYKEQSYSDGQLIITTRLVSTDWQKDIAGQSPYILVLFEQGDGVGLPPC